MNGGPTGPATTTTPMSGGVQNAIGMSGKNARNGAATVTDPIGGRLNAMDLAYREHYPAASNNYTGAPGYAQGDLTAGLPGGNRPGDAPGWMLNSVAPPVPYDKASAQKERLELKQDVQEAARIRAGRDATHAGDQGAVVYNAGGLDEEMEYVKHMKDQAELAKFDDYVSSMIDPREPGNLQWLMEVYPSFVTRRLQQAHSEYEFALRKQMIDQWGVNTFDDLHFLYMCDQGKFGDMPLLTRRQSSTPGDSYAPGFLGPYFHKSKGMDGSAMGLPFSSAEYGKKPLNRGDWTVDRAAALRPLARGNQQEMANAVFGNRESRGFSGTGGSGGRSNRVRQGAGDYP